MNETARQVVHCLLACNLDQDIWWFYEILANDLDEIGFFLRDANKWAYILQPVLTTMGGVFNEDWFYAVEDYSHVLVKVLQIIYGLGVELFRVQIEHRQKRLYHLRILQ